MSRRWLIVLIGSLLGALAGRVVIDLRGSVFLTPEPVDVSLWQVISPGLEAGTLHPGRGSHRVGGALVITDHLFFRADRLVPKLNGLASEIALQLSPDSATVEVLLGQAPTGMIRIHPSTYGRRVSLHITPEGLVFQTAAGKKVIGMVQPERLEISAVDGAARIEQVTIRDASGEVLLERDYTTQKTSGLAQVLSALTGAGVVGAWLFIIISRRPRQGLVIGPLLVAPVIGVLLVPADAWLPMLERLYLVDWSPSGLARLALGLSLLPVALGALAISVAPAWSRTRRAPRGLVALWTLLAVAAVFGRGALTPWMLGALAWVLLPWWLLRKDAASTRPWLALDLLALGWVVALGWAPGMLLGTLWRIAILVGGASVLARRAARPAMDTLFLLLIMLLPATEVSVRTGPLGASWDPTRLEEERPSERGWRDPLASWSGSCGPEDASRTLRFLVAGGSSVGGAYQYGDNPEASFVAQAHARLCESLPKGVALKTHNYGRGNRDTFTISRTMELMVDKAQPDLVALYVGVNDLLAAQYPMSRKQREEAREARHALVRGAAGIARRLHLVTGLWLATRDLPDPNALSVADVPLPDAVENFDQIAKLLGSRGVGLILMTEHTRTEQAGRLAAYRMAQQKLAETRQGVRFVDVRPAFTGATDEEMLVDQNHLSKEGGARLGVLLADAVGPDLLGQASSR